MPIRRQLKKVKNLLFTFFYDMYNSERFYLQDWLKIIIKTNG